MYLCTIEMSSTPTILTQTEANSMTTNTAPTSTIVTLQSPQPQQQQQQQPPTTTTTLTLITTEAPPATDQVSTETTSTAPTATTTTTTTSTVTATPTVTTTPETKNEATTNEPVTQQTPRSTKRGAAAAAGDDSSGKRPKSILDPATKIKILQLEEQGRSISQLAAEFGVGKQTIRDWRANRDKIYKLTSMNQQGTTPKKILKESTFAEMDKALHEWYLEQKAQNVHISGRILAEKALELNNHSNDFKASKGFIDRFCKRYDIKLGTSRPQKQISGKLVNSTLQPYIKTIEEVVKNENLTNRQVFSLFEAGLLWKNLPNKIMSQKTIADLKFNVERVTIGLCANSTGDFKLPLILINKPKKHLSCFEKSFNMANLPVDYYENYKAWMSQEIFYNWFHNKFVPRVDKYLEMNNLGRKALLLVENCAAHPVELISANGLIKCVFVPTKIAGLVQPMEHTPLTWIKRQYRVRMIRQLIVENEDKEIKTGVDDFLKTYMIDKCIFILASLWKDVSQTILSNAAWNNLNLIVTENKNADNSELFQNLSLAEKKHMAELVNIEEDDITDWLEVDKHILSHSIVPDYEVLSDGKKLTSGLVESNAEDNLQLPVTVISNLPVDLQAYSSAKYLLEWLTKKCKNPQPEQFTCLQSTLNSIAEQIIHDKQQTVQLDLNDLSYLF